MSWPSTKSVLFAPNGMLGKMLEAAARGQTVSANVSGGLWWLLR